MIEAQLYGLRRTTTAQAAQVTFGWKESGNSREFVQTLPADAREKSFVIPTGSNVVDDFVRFEAK